MCRCGSSTADDAYTNARREDLIQILDGLGAESRRLESEIAELEQTKSELQSGADTQPVARTETEQPAVRAGHPRRHRARRRARDPDEHRRPDVAGRRDVLLDAVEEMRDAGAEVIEINDTIRVVASSWFGTDAGPGGRRQAGHAARSRIEVIGDPHSLEEAARFRGGMVSEITGPRIGGQVRSSRSSDW